jgi:nucleotide-binding universal stress UspA family protein
MSPLPLTTEAELEYRDLGSRKVGEEKMQRGRHIRELTETLAERGIEAEAKVRSGLVVDEIFSETEQGDHDVLIIGAHRPREIQRYLLGDVSGEIVTYSNRSILVVRPDVIKPGIETSETRP